MYSLPKNLIINLDNLPEGESSFHFDKEIGYFYGEGEFSRVNGEKLADLVPGPVHIDISIMLMDLDLHLRGSVSAVMKKACDCCLEMIEREVAEPFSLVAIPAGMESHAKEDAVDLSYDDLSIFTYSTRSIDLKPILREQIELMFPLQFICREDCKGLCPHCGTNLNLSECKCQRGSFGEKPFQGLKSN